jgi:molybdenum cofactor biosynthesis enzyme MoaA
MNQFEYIKKVNTVIRTQKKTKNESMIFEALCSRELSLNDLIEFVKKVKKVGFSSNSTVSFINIETIPNIYIHQISFETGILNHGCVQSKSDSDYSSYVILDRTESKPKGEPKPKALEKCNSCGGKGVGLVSENGFCEHCNRTKQLHSCSVCNKQFSTNSGKDMHFKMKHIQTENSPLFSQVLESSIPNVKEPIYHIEKQSQIAQIEEEFVSLLSIPDSEEPIYMIDTSGLCQMGTIEPLTEYLITLFIVMYWKKHRLMLRPFYMVNIVQILCLKYLPH